MKAINWFRESLNQIIIFDKPRVFMSIQDLLIGKQLIKTEAHRRKILLGGYLILIYIGISLFFAIVNLFNPEGDSTSLFIGFLVSVVCIILLRKGWTNLALIIHFVRANFIAFYFSMIDENVLFTGTYIYFIPASLGALAVYGYTERWKGIAFTIISFALFLIALLRPTNFSAGDAHFYFIMNFFVIYVIGILIVIFFDRMVVTAERRITDKNKELIKANSELDRFVYSASHDLRAPLSSVLGLINISKHSGDPEEIKKFLHLMEGRVQHLDLFIHDIIDYSRNARLEAVKSKVNLKQLVIEVLESLRYSEDAVKLKIDNQVPAHLEIWSDPGRLKVIFTNIISNSIRYSDSSKPAPYILIEAVTIGEQTKILVKDNGLGISPEHHLKIFDMFYRASVNSKGSGLGLYIVKETLMRIGASIEMSSELGKGSTFSVILPRK